MGERGRAGRFVVGIAVTALLSGCAGSATSSPAPSSSPLLDIGPVSSRRDSSHPAARAPSATSGTPATVELTGFSVRPFGLAVTTSAYFAVDAAGNVYLPGGSKGAALGKIAPDGSLVARWAGFDVVPGQPDTVVGVAVDPASGDVWVTDTTADAVVHLGVRPHAER